MKDIYLELYLTDSITEAGLDYAVANSWISQAEKEEILREKGEHTP